MAEIRANLIGLRPKKVPRVFEAEKAYELTVPSHTESLVAIRSLLWTVAQAAGYAEPTVVAIGIAVEEACVNAIRHAHHNDATRPLRILINVDSQKLIITVKDQGPGFSKTPPEGLGILIMRMAMDEVHFEYDGDHGTKVRLTIYLRTNRRFD